ncbi:MAG: heme exporter protein CcmD [Steroidobacteraceae bacterium]
MREFMEMSGYWPFVWPAYALAMAGLVFEGWRAQRLLQRARQEAARKLASRETP